MMRARKTFGLVAALLAAAVMANPALAAKKDNSVRFAYDQTLDNIDPYFSLLAINAIIADNVWDTLVYRDPGTGTYKGDLATAWRWVDEKTLELDLREGVRFHNGAPFDADDVIYTLNFATKPENKIVNTGLVRWIDHVEKLSRYKLRIVARQPFPAAIAFLASPFSVIHPHGYYEKVGPKGRNEHPIGTGPFRVVEHALGRYVRLERNPDYFEDSPKSRPEIDKLEIRFIPDAQTRVAEIVSGGVDLVANVSPDQAEQLREVRSLQIVSDETMRFAHLRMNTMPGTPAPQLRDTRVRQAIMHAIDRESMVKFLLGKGSRVLHVECYPSQFGCDDAGVPHYAYDPQKARELLKEAGFPNGFDLDIYAYRDRNQTEAIIGYLRAVGIRARLRFLQASAVTTLRRTGKAALTHSTDFSNFIGDASASVSIWHEFSSDDMNKDPELRDLLQRADSAVDPDVRKQVYAASLKLIADRAYALPLYSLPIYYIASRDLVLKAYADEIPRFYEMSWK